MKKLAMVFIFLISLIMMVCMIGFFLTGAFMLRNMITNEKMNLLVFIATMVITFSMTVYLPSLTKKWSIGLFWTPVLLFTFRLRHLYHRIRPHRIV